MTHRPAACRIEALESRQLLSAVNPTDVEQYMLEYINRARANPAAEAARIGIDLNEGLPAGTISTAAKQPVAFNPYLIDAARKHSQWMIDNDVFAHEGVGGINPGQRMGAAGYAAFGTFSWGENLAYRGTTGTLQPVTTTANEHRDLFVDAGIEGRGHRTNMMYAAHKEVGVGIATGVYQGYNALMSTQDFASKTGDSFLTGVAFDDVVTADDFYTPGEGLGSVTITAVRAGTGTTYSTSTWSTGGYSLALPAGTYTVTFTGGELTGVATFANVAVGSQNVKLDVRPGQAVPVPIPVPPIVPTPDPTPDPTPSPDPTPDPIDDGGDGVLPVTPEPPPPPTGRIKGLVWNDANGDGKRDRRESPLAGQTVFLDLDRNGSPSGEEPTSTTDDAGAYTFEGLEGGGYSVRIVTPAGWRVTSPGGDAREAGVTSRKPPKLKPFGLTQSVTVGGSVFADANANGAADAGEVAFRKAKVFVDVNNDGVRQKSEPVAKVDRAGTFTFRGLAAGAYTIRLLMKPKFATTTPIGGAITIDVSTSAAEKLDLLFGVTTAA